MTTTKTGVASKALVLLILASLLSGGCSDDVVCPEIGPEALPFISASVRERDDSSGTETEASVFCTADPLPSLLIISISGRQVDGVATPSETGLLRTLEDDLVVWRPGAVCSLNVTTNYGFASATESELAKYVEYLKEENKILRARIPGQVHTKPIERQRLLKLGKPLGKAIEELITIVKPKTPLGVLTQRRRFISPSVARLSWPSGGRPVALRHRFSAGLPFLSLRATNIINSLYPSLCQAQTG